MRNTQLVRKIIRKHNKNAEIWTNKYAKCRTVKFHGRQHGKCTDAIVQELATSGIEHTVKFSEPKYNWQHPAVIVRVPLEY